MELKHYPKGATHESRICGLISSLLGQMVRLGLWGQKKTSLEIGTLSLKTVVKGEI